MGCTFAKDGQKISGERKSSTRKSTTESKINQALLKKKMEQTVANKPTSFEKILLKFDKLRVVLGYVKQIFNEFASDGKLDTKGLQSCMKRLNAGLTLEEIMDLFDFVDVQASNVITIKEFLVALTVGIVLDVLPALAGPSGAPPAGGGPGEKPALKRSVSGFMGHSNEIKEMLNLIVSAYLIFDPDGKGFIERASVEKMLDEQSKGPKGTGNNAMLSQQRWNEMDWDANGTIDFAEFVYAFASWVDIDEEQ